jgi:TPR repeat protein/uncharacterized protein YvpB
MGLEKWRINPIFQFATEAPYALIPKMKGIILLVALSVVCITYADDNLGIEKDLSSINRIKSESIYCDIKHIHQYGALCVCASAEMVLTYFGEQIDQREIKRLAEGKNYKDDDKRLYTITFFDELVKGLKKKGINWETKSFPMNNFDGGLRVIISQIESKNPVLIDTTLYGANTGHTVVINGYDEAQKKIIITDPYIEAPGIRILGVEEFKKIWNSKGARRALVLTSGKTNAIRISDEKGVTLSPEIVKQAEAGDEEAQQLAKKAEAGAAKAKQELEQLKSNAMLETSAEELVKMAEAGDAEAQFKLGQCHEKGYIGIKDNKEAVKWYTKSAEQGYTKAEFVLSLCYSEGKGVLRNKKEAEDWIAKVLAHANADELCAFSQYRVNNPMDDCSDWSKDLYEEEFECLKKSAELGNVVAQAQLANFYSSGRYVNRDQLEAVKWWTKSADQGNANAQFNLGMCYKYGSGVAKDLNEAIKWLTKAAEQNYANSKWHLEEIFSMPKKGL